MPSTQTKGLSLKSAENPVLPVYMDYAATTPLDPRILHPMIKQLDTKGGVGNSANPSHSYGRNARNAILTAQKQLASLLGAEPSEIVWTSGATESINLAIKGVAHAATNRKNHIVTSTVEHKAVLDSCKQLTQEGFDVTYLAPSRDGRIQPAQVAKALRKDTLLVSLMHVNNEVGSINDVAEISRITRSEGVFFHVDAAQSAARMPVDTRKIQADLMSLSAHKMYGPKGAGALYVRHRMKGLILPLMHGADSPFTLRPGMQATHQIVGMGAAAEILATALNSDLERLTDLDTQLRDGLLGIGGTSVNGGLSHRAPGILNVFFERVNASSLMMVVRDIGLSSGSACTSSGSEPSHVLAGMGISPDRAASSIRFSLGRFSTCSEVSHVVSRLQETVPLLRRMNRRWPSNTREQFSRNEAGVAVGE